MSEETKSLDEKEPIESPSELVPSLFHSHDPFVASPLHIAPPLHVTLAPDAGPIYMDFDDRSPRTGVFSNFTPSIHSSRRSGGSNPDLLQHGPSSFATSRKSSNLGRLSTASQTFRKPRPSTMLTDEIPKPWLKYKDPAHRWAKWVFWACWAAGMAVVAGLIYERYASIPRLGNLCLVMEDDFTDGQISSYNWRHQITVDPGRLGTFQWQTDSSNNSFIQDGTLYMVPTLTSDYLGEAAVLNGKTVNLTMDGTCTSKNVSHCAVSSNATLGTIVNPVQGVTLKSNFDIKYGKVEIVARLPTGDWIWPSLRMMPVNETYGAWPRSGEIDIINSRGNAPGYGDLGSDFMHSALHWGPNKLFDAYYLTWGIRRDKVRGYAKGYRTYTIEWSDKYLMTYIDNKVQTALTVKFDKPFWNKGEFPTFYTDEGGDTAKLENPWFTSTSNSAPFDQAFGLELSLNVGATTANYFPDNLGNKPWQDSSPLAMSDFWAAKERWWPSWPQDLTQRALAIKSVKMWKVC